MFIGSEQGKIQNNAVQVGMRRQDSELLDTALGRLEDAGVAVAEVATDNDDVTLIQLSLADHTLLYEVQLKAKISPASAQVSRPSPGRRSLLVAPHISDTVGDALRRQNVPYLDSVGNMHLRADGVLLDVRGRTGPTRRHGMPSQPLRAFKPSGLKILFMLLTDPDLVAKPYRDIAHACGVSLSTVQWVLSELETAGYVTTAPRRLYRTRNLLNRWVEAYAFDLYPRLTLGRFDVPNPSWWKEADDALRAADAEWGGETAAHRINPRLQPKRAVIYAANIPPRLATEFRFRKSDSEGGVEVRQRFWNLPASPSLTVPTPLIYGDLVASTDPRAGRGSRRPTGQRCTPSTPRPRLTCSRSLWY